MGCCAQRLSWVRHFATPWAVAHQAPLSMGLSRQEYWRGLPCPPPGGSFWPESNPEARSNPAVLQVDSLPLSHQGVPSLMYRYRNSWEHMWIDKRESKFTKEKAKLNSKHENSFKFVFGTQQQDTWYRIKHINAHQLTSIYNKETPLLMSHIISIRKGIYVFVSLCPEVNRQMAHRFSIFKIINIWVEQTHISIYSLLLSTYCGWGCKGTVKASFEGGSSHETTSFGSAYSSRELPLPPIWSLLSCIGRQIPYH